MRSIGPVCAALLCAAVSIACNDSSEQGEPVPGEPNPPVAPTGGAPTYTANAIGTGQYHNCAVVDTVGLVCWGAGAAGQLGYGATAPIGDDEPASSAGAVAVGFSVEEMVGGAGHTCVRSDAGEVKCWGSGQHGQLGYASTTSIGDDELPSSVGNVDIGGTAVQLALGKEHSCARLDDGSVRCWGYNTNGQLGQGNTTVIGDNEAPGTVAAIDLGTTAESISSHNHHTCAVLTGGTVRCWGHGKFGRLGAGNENTVGDDEKPGEVAAVDVGSTVSQIAVGGAHTCALLTDASVRCWGYNVHGQLGYANTSNIGDDEAPATAGNVDVGGNVSQLAAGLHHTCALMASGAVRCWGWNEFGQLGYGNTVTIGDDETPASAGDVSLGGPAQAIVAGDTHTCALLQSGVVSCWGNGFSGRLGLGDIMHRGDNELVSTVPPVPL